LLKSFNEVYNRSEGKPNLHLDVNFLADLLKNAIRVHQNSLKADFSLGGYSWPEGLLDDLRRLSNNTRKFGGPQFVDT
jgi:hypothetical protein